MSVFSMLSGLVEGARGAPVSAEDGAGAERQDTGAAGAGVRDRGGDDPARPEDGPPGRLVLGTVDRCPTPPHGGESRCTVALRAGRVYTVLVHTVPRGVHVLVSLYGPEGELIGCEAGWGRVRLVQSAPRSGVYSVSVEVRSGGEGFVLRVLSWSSEEIARAAEDPLYVL